MVRASRTIKGFGCKPSFHLTLSGHTPNLSSNLFETIELRLL